MPNTPYAPDTNNLQNHSGTYDSTSNSIDAKNEKDATSTTANSTSSTIDSLSPTDLEVLKYRYASLNFSLDSMLKHLEKSIVGQHESVRKLLFLVYNNQYLNMLEDCTGICVKRIHGLAIGPSGVGKTTTISKIAKLFNVPFVKVNATSLTVSGYAGGEVDSILLNLIRAAGNDIDLAQRGIVFIDEFDKKRSSDTNNSSGRDINGTSVQEEFLKIFEPSIVYVGKDNIPFDTHYLTVIAGGRFKGLEKIRESRLSGPKNIGFKPAASPEIENISSEYISQDLIDFGIIDELVGRIYVIAEFNGLGFNDILNMIYAEESILQQYLNVFASKDVDLIIDPIHFTNMAEELAYSSTGARDLEKKIIELIFPALYYTEQNVGPGICEIDADGKFSCVFESSKEKGISYNENISNLKIPN